MFGESDAVMSDVVPKSLKFRAFLSYRSSDRKLAVWLHRKLETYRIPKRLVGVPTRFGPVPTRVTPVFRDRDDARGASDIETTIKSYLAQSEHLIVLCTPSSAQSDSWVGREIELFKRERPGAEVHAVIGEGTPPSCIPKQLLRQSGDGTIHSPLAADLRPVAEGGDGMRRGFIKLVASLIGVEFDDLWLREHRRRRLSAMLWSFLIVAAISAGATWIHDHEVTRLTSIGSAAQRLDPVTNQALVDLLTIASTPAEGGLVSSNGYRLEGVAAIASRTRPALSGSVAMRHQDLNARIVFRSDDRQLIFSADDSDVRELFVWNTVTHKLVARIPVRLNYWMPTTTSDLANGTGRLMGLNVSKDGRLVAAVYAPIKDARWIAASWQLDPQGGCKAPCLPKTFNLEMPMPEKWSSGDLRFTADTKSAWFTYRSKMPYVVDFSVGKATPAASLEDVDLRHCSFALPDTVLPK